MSLKKLFLKWQILLLILLIVASVIAIYPNPNAKGVIISSVGEGAFYGKVDAGTIVYSAGFLGADKTSEIFGLSDLLEFQGESGYLILNTDHGSQTILLNEESIFNVSVEKIPSSNLAFGLDIEGGTRALLKPENLTNTSLDAVITTLETRINVYGLRQTEFRKVEVGDEQLIMISIAGGTLEEIEELISRKGEFKATIPMTLKDGETFLLGKALEGENEEIGVEILDNTSAKIGENTRLLDESFELKGIRFTLTNITSTSVTLEGIVFSGNDIINTGIPPESSRFQKSGDGYSYQFGVVISREGAQKFAELTQNLDTLPTGNDGSLSEKLHLYLDNSEFDALSISASLRGREITNPVITGYGATKEEAIQSRDTLKAVLKSGDLPTEIEVVSIDQLDSSLGEGYLRIISIAGFVAIILVSTVIFIRYRKPALSFGVMATMLSEVVLILGFAALTNWNLSSLALAGIIAAIGFGVDDQILIIDETIKRRERFHIREGLKRAFFMIFGAGATTIFAMIPIFIMGFGAFKEISGFALTTVVGVLIGIFITRPAFSKYVEYVNSK